MGTDSVYRSYRNKLAACNIARGRCRPACNSTGGRGGRGNSLHPSHPHPTHFFCPVPANRPKEMNKLHPSRIFSPSVNYHKQMLGSLAIWSRSRSWVPPGPFRQVLAWLLAWGTQPTIGIAATMHNGGFNWVHFLVNTAGIDAAISLARIFIHWCHFFSPAFGPEAQLQRVDSKGCFHEAGL